MKKYLMVAILVVLIACTVPVSDDVITDSQDVEEPEEKEVPKAEFKKVDVEEKAEPEEKEIPAPEPSPEPEPEVAEQETEVSGEGIVIPEPGERTPLYDYLDVFAQNVKGYSFRYKDDEYYVRGKQYKILLDSAVQVKDAKLKDGSVERMFHYDTVIIDRELKTATAYCEGNNMVSRRQCDSLEIYDKAYAVDYEEHNIDLPEDWISTYIDAEPLKLEVNKYYIRSHQATLVLFDGNPQVELSIDERSGLPIRVDFKTKPQAKQYMYTDLSVNSVRPIDVEHKKEG